MLESDLLKFKDSKDILNWSIYKPPDEATRMVHDAKYEPFVPLTTEEMETVVIQPGFRIVLPIDSSFGPPYEQTHVFDKPLTLRGFIEFIYTFYNTELLLMEYSWARRLCWNLPAGTSSAVTLMELMGDHVFYEGIGPDGHLHLGS
jgi:hypothetical protein